MSKRGRIAEELRDHLDRRALELQAGGVAPAEARRRAAAEFGSPESVAQEIREARPLRWLREALADCRFALRSWRRAPGFAATALLILACGIGGNVVIFGLVRATLLRPLPFPHDRQLVYVSEYDSHGANQSFSDPDMRDFRTQTQPVFSAMGGYRDFSIVGTTNPAAAVRIGARLMTAGMFRTLGVRPRMGRWFTAQEHQPHGPRAVILSYGFWQTHFGGRPQALGTAFSTSAGPLRIVGVMPAGFRFGALAQIYLPYEEFVPTGYLSDRADSFILYGVGRMRPGVAFTQVQAQLAAISARLAKAYPASNATVHARALPLHQEITRAVGGSLWMIFAAVTLLLLLVCVNLANLLLARAAARGEELAVRAALGAGRGRLARQLLSEGLLLALVGCAGGLGLAAGGLRTAAAALPKTFPYTGALALSPALAGYAVALALVTGALFSLAPMLLAAGTSVRARGSAGRHRLHSALIIAEVAMAMTLLTAAGLMVRSMAALDHVDLGFQPRHVLTATVSLATPAYASTAAATRFFHRLETAVAALPGVQSAGMVFPVPYTTQIANCYVATPGHAPDPNAPLTAYYFNVSAGYFRTLQQPLLRGRTFTAADDAPGAPPVVIVDESLAQQYYGSVHNALGNRIQPFTQTFGQTGPGTVPPATIVGVVARIKAEGPDIASHRELYFPLSQPNGRMTLVVRSMGNAATLGTAVRDLVHTMDASLVPPRIASLESLVAQAQSTRILSLRLLALFAVVALLLAGMGLYGVLAYLVEQRRRELGIRLALGASRPALLRLILGQGVRWVLVGLVLGGAAAAALGGLMSGLLYGVTPLDPLTLAACASALLLAAFLACYVPGRRAARLDPLQVLRAE